MEITELISIFPYLYHVTESGSWSSIQKYGLLSTTALLDLFDISGVQRQQIESKRRPKLVVISHPQYGNVSIQDQQPMSDAGLQRVLTDMAPQEWYELLNRKVFFWLCEERLTRHLNARGNRDKEHDVLIVDTQALIETYGQQISLAPMNTGSTIRAASPRGSDTFKRVQDYPYAERRKRYRSSKQAIVEFTVDYAISHIQKFILKVECRKQDNVIGCLYTKSDRVAKTGER